LRQLPIQDSSSLEILNSEHSSLSWGITIAGKPWLIPSQITRRYIGKRAQT